MMILFLAWDAFVLAVVWKDHRRKKGAGDNARMPLLLVIYPVRMILIALLIGGTTSVISEGRAVTILAPALPLILGFGVGLLRGPDWLEGRMLRTARLNNPDEEDG